MKLTEKDIGKYFKSHNGHKMFCAGMNEHGRMVMCQDDACYTVYNNGVYVTGQLSAEDIIAPWPETRTIKGWVNIYPSEYVYPVIFPDKATAKSYTKSYQVKPIACVEIPPITYTEGEGLSDDN